MNLKGYKNEIIGPFKFALPVVYGLLFWIISVENLYFLYFGLPLITGVLTLLMGEFNEKELKTELVNFNSSPYIHLIKCLSGIIFILMAGWSLYFVWSIPMTIMELCLFTFFYGVINGVIGYSLLHELVHTQSRLMRILGKIFSVILCFSSFRSDHLFGHHQWAATNADFTTAKRDQNLYAYLSRLMLSRLQQAYTFNNPYPANKKKSILIENAFTMSLSFLFLLSVSLISLKLGLFFMVQCIIASFLYNTSNYIQHYGLNRKPIEPFSNRHAWNSYYKYFCYLTFMMPVHSYHHLENSDNEPLLTKAPKMPFPYIVMFMLAFIPGLWFRKMNPLLAKF